jgi:transposase
MHDMGNSRGRPPEGSAAALRASRSAEKPTKPTQRAYTVEYKRRILEAIDELRVSGVRGEIGAMLRREGLNSAIINRWEKTRAAGRLGPQKRGRKPTRSVDAEENERLKKRIEKLEKDLRKAEIIIDVQKNWARCWGSRCRTFRIRRRTDCRDSSIEEPRTDRWCGPRMRRPGREPCVVLPGPEASKAVLTEAQARSRAHRRREDARARGAR